MIEGVEPISETALPSAKVAIVPYRPGWAESFAQASRKLEAVLESPIVHVGSTAVQGLDAKPTIDMLAFLSDWETLDVRIADLEALGWTERERVYDEGRRVYLERYNPSEGVSFHLHVVSKKHQYGQDMIDFRDALAASPARRHMYAALKHNLVNRHLYNLTNYTAGKSYFVREVLQMVRDPYGVDRLLTHQRAELDAAQRLQGVVVFIQLLIALVAGASVFSNNNGVLLNLAITGILLVLVWIYAAYRQRRYRAVGDQARRVALLRSGLDCDISVDELRQTFESFTTDIRQKHQQTEQDYFVSREPPGHRRLLELIAESAYWTEDLQKISAKAVWTILFSVIAAPLLLFWGTFGALETDYQISFARVLVTLFVFLLSADIVGTAIGHSEAYRAIACIRQRISAVEARGYPDGDVKLLLVDYNSIIQAAPVTPPFVYRTRKSWLSEKWEAYRASRVAEIERRSP